jgi:hypothetical protein
MRNFDSWLRKSSASQIDIDEWRKEKEERGRLLLFFLDYLQ